MSQSKHEPGQAKTATPFAPLSYRVAAVLIDHIIIEIIVYVSVMMVIRFSVPRQGPTSGPNPTPGYILTAIGAEYLFGIEGLEIFLLFFLPVLLYFIVLEGQTGQTLGKMILDIRVVDETSLKPAGIVQALIRNIVRIIDVLPLFYVVGFFVAVTNDRSRRLGDIAAQTVVIKAQKERRKMEYRIVHKIVLRERA